MKDNFKLEIISPDKIIFSGDAKMVVLPSYEGDMSILKKSPKREYKGNQGQQPPGGWGREAGKYFSRVKIIFRSKNMFFAHKNPQDLSTNFILRFER